MDFQNSVLDINSCIKFLKFHWFPFSILFQNIRQNTGTP